MSSRYEFYGSVDDRGRRTWDTEAYERKAKYGHAGTEANTKALALSDKRNLPPSQRDLLTARDYKVDLDSRLNRTSVISDGGKVSHFSNFNKFKNIQGLSITPETCVAKTPHCCYSTNHSEKKFTPKSQGKNSRTKFLVKTQYLRKVQGR